MENDKPQNPAPQVFVTRMFFEAVALRENGPDIEVYMCKLPTEDPAFANLWTVPRLRLLYRETIGEVVNRIQKEFGVQINEVEYIFMKLDPKDNETLFSSVYIVVLDEDPQVDEEHNWFPIMNLPPTTATLHRNHIIPRAVAAFERITLK